MPKPSLAGQPDVSYRLQSGISVCMAVVQRLRCQLERIIDHGQQVYTLELRPEHPVPRFLPGQFLHLALDAYDPCDFWPESRAFSIASPPTERTVLRISYSVHGRFTARMERELHVGRCVWVKLPYGEFVVDGSRPAVLLAGGTGITAFSAFLAGLTPDHPHPVWLAYGARDRQRLIYRSLIEQQAHKVSRLRVYYFVEQDDDGGPSTPDGPEPPVKVGRMSCTAVWPDVERPDEALFYLSGPPAMLKTLTAELRMLGVSPAAIRTDAWE